MIMTSLSLVVVLVALPVLRYEKKWNLKIISLVIAIRISLLLKSNFDVTV